jgi:hypothetical protein
VAVDIGDNSTARLTYETENLSGGNVVAHVTLMPHMGKAWETASGKRGILGEAPLRLGPDEAGAWLRHHGWRISLPPGASIVWPALPHNPYRKDGSAKAEEGRIVVVIPFTSSVRRHEFTVVVPVE